MVDKDLNILMNVLLGVYICPLRKQIGPFAGVSEMYRSDTIANSQRTPAEIHRNDAIARVKISVELVVLYDI